MMALGTLAGLALAAAAGLEPAEIRIEPSFAGESAWHAVTYRLPSAGVESLALVDMSGAGGHCPEIEYEMAEVHGAVRLEDLPAAARPGALAYFRPEVGASDMSIGFRVRMVEPEQGLSAATAVQCDLLVQRGASILLDGKALLPAPRPIGLNGTPFRFGETRVTVSRAGAATALSTLGPTEGEAQWSLSELDEARFAYFFVSAGAMFDSPEDGVVHVPLDTGAAGRFGDLDTVAHHAASILEAMFGAPGPSWYVIVSLTGHGADFADYTGTARPGGQRLVIGSGAPEDAVRVLAIHELSHHWDIARFRELVPSEDLTWLREGLAEFLAHAVLAQTGALSDDALVHRANLALYNLGLPDSHGARAYDEGYLAWFALHQAAAGGDAFSNFLTALIAPGQPQLTGDGFWAGAQAAGLTTRTAGRLDPQSDLPCTVLADGVEYNLQLRAWPAYDSGLSFDQDRPGRIVAVHAGGAAEQAGLRPGDQVDRLLSGGYGRIFEPLTFRLSDGQIAAFMPHGPARAPYLQYVETSKGRSAGPDEPAEIPCLD